MNKPRNILICPLEWGLGHAARMIPVAARLLELNNKVFIGAGDQHLALFRSELKGLVYVKFPGFRPAYSRHLPQYLAMLFKTPLLLYHIIAEHRKLKRIISEYSIDMVISDNRFGLWNKSIKTVYVTHMPRIPLPKSLRLLEYAGVLLHRFIIGKYSLCLIPDLPGDINLSGRLSHGLRLPVNVRYAGILSRFSLPQKTSTTFSFPHNTLILSGPEPQRSMLKYRMMAALKDQTCLTVILEGRPDLSSKPEHEENFISYSHLPAADFTELVISSEGIVSRSGYTTIMDLVTIGTSALLIPTPGQTEQEYLSEYMSSRGWFTTISQKDISDAITLPPAKKAWSDEIIVQSRVLFEKVLGELLEE